MKRMKVLFGQRRIMVLATLAILVLTAAALVASSASFTATSANVDNVFTAGTMSLSAGGAQLNLAHIMPDDQWVSAGSITLTNGGDSEGALAFTASGIENTPDVGGSRLSDVLQLRITDPDAVAPETALVYEGPINAALVNVVANSIPAGGTNTYEFEVMFPNHDTVAFQGADNGYKLSSMTIDFDWTIANL